MGFVRQAIAFFHGVYGVGTCSKIFEVTLFCFFRSFAGLGRDTLQPTASSGLG